MPDNEEQTPAVQDQSGSTPAPVETPEVVASTPAVQPAAAQAAGQGSPWDADLAAHFSDETTRSSVSAFLAEKVQPYVTQKEQSSKQAVELYDDFNSKPKDTYLEVTEELYGPEAAQAVRAYLDSLETPAAETPAPGTPAPERDPEVQALLDERQAKRDEDAFNAEYDKVRAANPTVHFERDLFIPVVADTGDFTTAVTKYQEKYGPYLEYAKQQAEAAAAAGGEPAPTAPATLGAGEAAGAGEVPTEKEYANLDEAVDDFFAEQRAAGKPLAPPVPTG